MTPSAWAESNAGDYGVGEYTRDDFGGVTSFDVARVALLRLVQLPGFIRQASAVFEIRYYGSSRVRRMGQNQRT